MRILVLRLSSLGDIVLTQSVLAELQRLNPEAEIHFLCKKQYSELPRLFDPPVTVVNYSRGLFWHLGLWGKRYGLVLDLHAKFSTWLIRVLVRSPRKICYNKRRRLRQAIVKGKRNAAIESTVRLYYSALERLDPDSFNPRTPFVSPRMRVPESAPLPQNMPPRDSSRPLLGIFVGAAHATKIYPLHQWREFVRLTRERYEIWLLGNQTDSVFAKAIARDNPGIANLCGKLELRKLAQAIDNCDAILSGDSGPMHLAAALGKAQVAIFGGTHPRLGFAPLNPRARVLSTDLDCQPCSLHGLERCPRGHFNCMRTLPPHLILNALEEVLAIPATTPRRD